MSRFLFRSYGFFHRLRQWERRRFTRAGMGVLAALIVTTAMAPDSDNNMAYQGMVLLAGLLAVGIACSFWFRGRFELSRILPRFATVGSPLHYAIVMKNLASRTQAGLHLLEDMVEQRLSFEDWLRVQQADRRRFRSFRVARDQRINPFKSVELKDAAAPPSAPGQEIEVAAELTPLRRGSLYFKGLIVARADPLGLFRAFHRFKLPQSVLVLPKRYPLPPVALPGDMKYQEGGVALASNVGQSDEFVSLRDYRYGDPLRHIHWRSWARVGKPVVKEFEDEFFVRHALILDTFIDHPHSEVFEEAVSVAASFACTVQTQESLLDLLFVGPESYCFTAGRGLAHSDQLLEVLASVKTCGDHPFQTLEHLVLNHVKVVSGCICVLIAWDEPRQEFIRKLQALGVPLLVLVVVPPGATERIQSGPMADDPERFHVLELGKIEEGLLRLK